MKVFFIVVALAVAANQLVLSTSTVDEKSKVVDRDEERGGEAVKLFGQTIAEIVTLHGKRIVLKPTGQILSESEQEAPPQMIHAEGSPRQKDVKLFGATISSPKQVPEAVAQLASQGNIRNHVAVDNEKMKQRVTNVLLDTQTGPSSSVHDKLLSTRTEAGPHDPTAAEEVAHRFRGVKRKELSSLDETQRLQLQEAQKKAQKHWLLDRPSGMSPRLSDLIRVWGIDVELVEQRRGEISKQLEQRKQEISKTDLPNKLELSEDEVKLMAVGSIYFERDLNTKEVMVRAHPELLKNEVKNFDGDLLDQLGVERKKVNKRAFDMFFDEDSPPSHLDIVYMAIGMEFYRPPHPRGVST